jgi:hypothetical protein
MELEPHIAPPLDIPTPPPSRAAFAPTIHAGIQSGQWMRVKDPNGREGALFLPPNPVYWTLTNNVPTDTMTVSG